MNALHRPATYLLWIVSGLFIVSSVGLSYMGARAVSEYYRGAYDLCFRAFDNSGLPESDIIALCNSEIAQARGRERHLDESNGYEP